MLPCGSLALTDSGLVAMNPPAPVQGARRSKLQYLQPTGGFIGPVLLSPPQLPLQLPFNIGTLISSYIADGDRWTTHPSPIQPLKLAFWSAL